MKLHKCIVCEQFLPFEMFYKNKSKLQGRNSSCKKCDSKQNLRRYYANRPTILQRIHKYYQDNKEKCKATGKAYYLKHHQRYLEYHKQLDIENLPKRQCRNKVRTAIKNGELKRGYCEDCKVSPNQEKIYGHHEDYNKPLEIIWLCQSCHMRRHSTFSSVAG